MKASRERSEIQREIDARRRGVEESWELVRSRLVSRLGWAPDSALGSLLVAAGAVGFYLGYRSRRLRRDSESGRAIRRPDA